MEDIRKKLSEAESEAVSGGSFFSDLYIKTKPTAAGLASAVEDEAALIRPPVETETAIKR